MKESVFSNNLIDALRHERLNGEKYTFYSGMNANVAALIQVYSMMRTVLMMESGGASVSMLRAFDEAFFSIRTVDDFISKFNDDHIEAMKENLRAHYNYLPGYVEQGISVNNNLFGGFENHGDNTLAYAAESQSAAGEVTSQNAMCSVLGKLWQVSPDSSDVIERAKRYVSIIKHFNI